MMPKVKIFADKSMVVGGVSPGLFSAFVEHLGRCVYTGIYEPGHPAADADGFRQDVLELVNGLNLSMVRYPGGNFLSGYDWRDGIGKKESRPARLDLAWRTTETNQFGTDEFAAWCRKAKVEPMMAVNMGTGSPLDAANLLEYCNHPKGTFLSDLRRENGNDAPYNIKTWCIGNEMDGPWQTCAMSAEDYGKKALATARMMRNVDPSVKLVACGSSTTYLPTYPEWDRIVLDALYEEIDYLSMHDYYWPKTTTEDYFASYREMDNFIKTIKSIIEFVRVKHRSSKQVYISFDEWNVWYQQNVGESDWEAAPRKLEDIYSLKDALVFSGLLNTLLNNCDYVKVACLAQLVNVIAPIFTEPGGKAIKQTTYYPFELASKYGRGTVLQGFTECPKFNSKFGETDYVSSAVVHNDQDREITVFLTNYNDSAMECALTLNGFSGLSAIESVVMNGADLDAKNTIKSPDTVVPSAGEKPVFRNGPMVTELPPLSYNMLRFAYK